jgi:hypothetical protein
VNEEYLRKMKMRLTEGRHERSRETYAYLEMPLPGGSLKTFSMF